MDQLTTIVMPFYNEEANVERVVRELSTAFDGTAIRVEFVCVCNGSRDRTGEILANLAQADSRIKIVTVAVNQGYGYGVRQGLAAATGAIVGYLDGDGQVLPADVIQVLHRMAHQRAAKTIRVTRDDGWQRRLVSAIYNCLFRVLFGFRAHDVNAKPKFLHKEDLAKLALVSNDWFIDAEVMIKSAALGIHWDEIPVRFRERTGGSSNVRISSIIEFLNNLGCWRFGQLYNTWKRTTLPS
ncbi:MAG: Undecaprenyl-phosphate 4-deoxy-4-formamido-L-arabinose transferase [Verrucomicrobiae bacterium]|nr:Undecaprenyl-phosphate 4-deoxy-4-formamido-L-arabinose transferase [Verrucomicrobiae bacterium]